MSPNIKNCVFDGLLLRYSCMHFKIPLQDIVDGDDDRTAAEELSDANSADVGKTKFNMLRLSDHSLGSNSL